MFGPIHLSMQCIYYCTWQFCLCKITTAFHHLFSFKKLARLFYLIPCLFFFLFYCVQFSFIAIKIFLLSSYSIITIFFCLLYVIMKKVHVKKCSSCNGTFKSLTSHLLRSKKCSVTTNNITLHKKSNIYKSRTSSQKYHLSSNHLDIFEELNKNYSINKK